MSVRQEVAPVGKQQTTLNDVWEEYASVVLDGCTARTAYVYRNAFKKRVAHTLGVLPVADIGPLDVRKAWAMWSGSQSSKVDALSVTSKTLQVALEAGLVQSNVARGLRLKRQPEKSPASRALTPAELSAFIARVPAGPYRRIVQALAYSGCRLGEICGLTPADIDMGNRLIRVARSLSPDPSGKLTMGDTKSHKVRMVPVLPQLVPVLEEAMAGRGAHDLIFVGPRGGALDASNLARAIGLHKWRDEVRLYPLGERALRLNDLRHTACVLMLRAGIPANDVQALMGHSSLATTQIYARADSAAAMRAGERFGAWLATTTTGDNSVPGFPKAHEINRHNSGVAA
ncbi:tyrosine-type recombinase/integrase [Leucobacter sp. 1207-22]|uniref:tyrosine-type recombinase/integrase n=1 Tax=Leucobacter sp. 1207-22 TaxID=2604456 RepID=UPI00406345AD